MEMRYISTLIIGCLCFLSYGQVVVEREQLSNISSFEGIDELQRPNFNDFFKEIDPMEMTFKPVSKPDSTWIRLDIDAIYDLDMGNAEISGDDEYYGIGRYELKGITYYFVGMPIAENVWNVTVMVCNGTGEFTDGYAIAYGVFDPSDEVVIYGWVEYLERSNEIILITRRKETSQNRGGEEEYTFVEELYNCEAFCLREGEFAPYTKGNVKSWNKKYTIDE